MFERHSMIHQCSNFVFDVFGRSNFEFACVKEHIQVWSICRIGVKSSDPAKTTKGESTILGFVRQWWTKVKGTKMIRYRRSLDYKRCQQNTFVWNYPFFGSNKGSTEMKSLSVRGVVWSQGWNLKELTEKHHQVWNLRLNSTQHGKAYRDRTREWLTDYSSFLISWKVVHGHS